MFEHMRAAMRTKGITASQKLVLVCLADHADEDGLAYPSVKTISTCTGLKDRAIRSALDALHAMNVIARAETPINGATQRWIVAPKPVTPVPVADTTPALDAALLKEEPRHLMPGGSASNAGGGRHLMPGTSASNADKATKKQPIEATTEDLEATAPAAPPVAAQAKDAKPPKPAKTDARKALNAQIRLVRVLFAELFAPPTDRDATFLGRNIQDAVQCYPVDDVAGTLRAIAARNPNAKATGRTISLIDLGSWVDEWLAADRPAVFPTAVLFRRSGETNDRPTSRFAQASQRVTDRDGWLQFKQSLQAGGVAASAS